MKKYKAIIATRDNAVSGFYKPDAKNEWYMFWNTNDGFQVSETPFYYWMVQKVVESMKTNFSVSYIFITSDIENGKLHICSDIKKA